MDEITGTPVFGLWLGAFICTISLFCGVFMIYLDKRRDRLLNIYEKKTLSPEEKVRLQDIQFFGWRFWLVTINLMLVYVSILSFNNIATRFFQVRFGYSKVNSGMIISIYFIVGALTCPFMGLLVDRIGKRPMFVIFATAIMLVVHTIFMLIPDCDECSIVPINLVLMGFGYSIFACVIWTCIPFVVNAKTIGTAFGLACSAQNIGLGIGPIVIGALNDGY